MDEQQRPKLATGLFCEKVEMVGDSLNLINTMTQLQCVVKLKKGDKFLPDAHYRAPLKLTAYAIWRLDKPLSIEQRFDIEFSLFLGDLCIPESVMSLVFPANVTDLATGVNLDMEDGAPLRLGNQKLTVSFRYQKEELGSIYLPITLIAG